MNYIRGKEPTGRKEDLKPYTNVKYEIHDQFN